MQGRQEGLVAFGLLVTALGSYCIFVPCNSSCGRCAMMDELTPLDRLHFTIAAALEQLELVNAPTPEHKDTIRLLLERALVAANNIYRADKGQCMLDWDK